MIRIKTPDQIAGIRKSSQIAAKILKELGSSLYIGMKTQELDDMNMLLCKKYGAIPAPLNYKGFPKSLCVSKNDVICHGIPGEEILEDGDIVNIDVTTIVDGYFGDTSATFLVGKVSQEAQDLVETTKKSLNKGIEQVFPGNYLSNIGYAIQHYVEKKGYSVVRDYCGHGVGIEFHEDPHVMHFGRKNRGEILKPGMIFTIEPMINMGDYECEVDRGDKWTVRTVDGSLSAQFEDTVLVTEKGCEILTIHVNGI